jgi:hypothetical protein
MEQPDQMMGFIREASRGDAAAITDLRIAAYYNAPEFSVVDADTLCWDKKDEDSIVLAVWSRDGQVLSTTRAEVYPDQCAAEEAMECSVEGSVVEFPVLLLGKGATRQGYGRHGLHSALRFHLLQAADQTEVRTVLGIVYSDAPRVHLMERIGYRFVEPERIWYTDLSPRRPTLVGILNRERLKLAYEHLRAETTGVLGAYPFVGRDLNAHIAELLLRSRPRIPVA